MFEGAPSVGGIEEATASSTPHSSCIFAGSEGSTDADAMSERADPVVFGDLAAPGPGGRSATLFAPPPPGHEVDPKVVYGSEPCAEEETTFLGFVEEDESHRDDCSDGHACWDARFQLLLPISPSKSSGGRLPGDVEEVKPERGIF